MIFELIDSKHICNSCYVNGEIVSFSENIEFTHTWDYSPLLKDKKYELASLYCGTKNIEDACSNELRERYVYLKSKVKSYLKSFITAAVSLEENCFFDLTPIHFIHELFSVRAEIIRYIFDNYKRPENYDFLYDLNRMLIEISDRKIKINVKDTILVKEIKNFSKFKNNVRYNMYGTITGRLASGDNCFPILTMDKKFRSVIEPTNDFLLELDFNAVEPRIFLALSGQKQPLQDLHEWNKDNIFIGHDRESAKKKFLAWFYDETGSILNTETQLRKLESFYKKTPIKEKYYKDGVVRNYYGREILSDKEHAFNYIIQSTSADMFLRQAVKVNNLLKDKKTFVKFLIHDSIVLDVSSEDKELIKEISSTFKKTEFGTFRITKKIGKNYGSMKQT